MRTAILFNGAAAYIGQEVGILDLLRNDSPTKVSTAPGFNKEDVKFVGGLSSGALMSFSFNVAFCNPPKITWDVFKDTRLFNLTTDKIYTGQKPFDTSPLRRFLEDIIKDVGYNYITDLPIDTAILVSYIPFPLLLNTHKSYWLTNIASLASELPTEGDISGNNTNTVTKNIKEHQSNLELVSSLMCSTAIPETFPPQELHYKEENKSQSIMTNVPAPALFYDGGSGINQMVFSSFQEFFDAYLKHNQKFDNIYFISPNFAKTEAEALQRISQVKSRSALGEVPAIDPAFLMDTWTNSFIKALKEYNSENILADTIYYCKPDVDGYNALDFSNEKAQYTDTITWGQSHPNDIAIDINNISDI